MNSLYRRKLVSPIEASGNTRIVLSRSMGSICQSNLCLCDLIFRLPRHNQSHRRSVNITAQIQCLVFLHWSASTQHKGLYTYYQELLHVVWLDTVWNMDKCDVFSLHNNKSMCDISQTLGTCHSWKSFCESVPPWTMTSWKKKFVVHWQHNCI
jgi:hypothetical protein